MDLNENLNNQIDKQINSLLDFSIDNLTEDIVPQSNQIDSQIKNNTAKSIHNSINELYQRIRTLEAINDYVKHHALREVSLKTENIKEIVDEIISLESKSNKMTYEEYISLISTKENYTDKDGQKISKAKINNGSLVLNYESLISATIDSATINRKTIMPYKATPISNIIKGTPYRTMYILKDYQENGVVESFIFKLSTPLIVNQVDIGLHNCYIDSISLTDINNNKKIYKKSDLYNIIKNNQLIQEIEVTLTSKNFKQAKYNKIKLDNDFYNSINSVNKNPDSNIYKENYSKDSLYIHEDSPNIIREKEIIDPEMSLIYIFGIDYIKVKYVEQDNKSFFISEKIKLKQGAYLLEAIPNHILGDGSIEYFYIKNNKKIYIPNSKGQNINEYFFFNTNNNPSEDRAIINGVESNISDAQNGSIITYNTDDNNKISVSDKDIIQIGAILRSGDVKDPLIQNIKVIQYIGDNYE